MIRRSLQFYVGDILLFYALFYGALVAFWAINYAGESDTFLCGVSSGFYDLLHAYLMAS
jgi:hypothetical protein